MTVETTLAKADADLRAGRTPVARQRLRGLVGSCPADLTARRRLAEVYRLYGEPAEAGRWAYLDEDRDPAETAAFEARYADPVERMLALAWRGPEAGAATATARARLAEVREAASAHLGRPIDVWSVQVTRRPAGAEEQKDRTETLFCAGFAVIGLFLLGLTVLGAVTAVGWLL
ncbi:DUF6584 family protein [Kitasatospora sp. DSM 101779]|uniref:DUF6584 family protein n=1 Tax=Kitasatospora sp. DSM 101779 TaxID=2853165 RepID=UPI0021D7E888|nr:DUF6584 family protein [Kitasatospora sp. DSM 101779]MCU7826074.1 hypothetical protein [Kitasatospora sp. DSM 101779]